MPKLNLISGRKMIKILKSLDFELLRSKGSHNFFYNHESKKHTTVPLHANRDLGIGILKEILKDIDLSVEKFEKLRKK